MRNFTNNGTKVCGNCSLPLATCNGRCTASQAETAKGNDERYEHHNLPASELKRLGVWGNDR